MIKFTVMPRKSKSAHAAEVVRRLHQEYPDAHIELDYKTPFQLLIATILAAQCTDVRVNVVTKTLFKKYKSPEDYLKVPQNELEEDVHSVSFFRSKTRNIRGACHKILDDFHGEVPQTMEELVTLPGVGRKTANVVLGIAFGKASGIVVDTHVKRVTFRLGMTSETEPEKVEQDLIKLIPQEEWTFAANAIIWHGRRICHARKPECSECVLEDICPKRGGKERQ
jgi:endonuclease-3